MLKAHDTKGYSADDGRLFGKERFSPTKNFFAFSKIKFSFHFPPLNHGKF